MITEALAVAVVDIGLSPEAFACLSLDEWQAIARRLTESVQTEYQERWERTRALVYASLAPNLKEGVSLKEVMPLPWDEVPVTPALPTAEEREEMLRRYS